MYKKYDKNTWIEGIFLYVNLYEQVNDNNNNKLRRMQNVNDID